MNPTNSGENQSRRGPNFEKNRRPATSTRATFALGQEALEQADRLARIASNHKEGGVSRSAVLRGLLKFAEDAALKSGDNAVAGVFANSRIPESGKLPRIEKSSPEFAKLWQLIRAEILES
jgi:hypothetical protein